MGGQEQKNSRPLPDILPRSGSPPALRDDKYRRGPRFVLPPRGVTRPLRDTDAPENARSNISPQSYRGTAGGGADPEANRPIPLENNPRQANPGSACYHTQTPLAAYLLVPIVARDLPAMAC